MPSWSLNGCKYLTSSYSTNSLLYTVYIYHLTGRSHSLHAYSRDHITEVTPGQRDASPRSVPSLFSASRDHPWSVAGFYIRWFVPLLRWRVGFHRLCTRGHPPIANQSLLHHSPLCDCSVTPEGHLSPNYSHGRFCVRYSKLHGRTNIWHESLTNVGTLCVWLANT